jgi:GNAT superfamily N-acetyltransferase
VITLAPAKPADVAAMASLLAELDEYYGGTREEPSDERLHLISDAVSGPSPSAHVLLAWDDDRLVGLASYSFLWPAAGVTRSIFLKELYVVKQSRHRGVGQLLMSELCRIALDNDCSRVEWAADTDNPIALQFYETLGVPPNQTKLFYRLDGKAMAQMATASAAQRTR